MSISALSGNHAYVKTLYDAWIPEFRSGFGVVGSGTDPDLAGTEISRSGLDADPAGSENFGSGAPLLKSLRGKSGCADEPACHFRHSDQKNRRNDRNIGSLVLLFVWDRKIYMTGAIFRRPS